MEIIKVINEGDEVPTEMPKPKQGPTSKVIKHTMGSLKQYSKRDLIRHILNINHAHQVNLFRTKVVASQLLIRDPKNSVFDATKGDECLYNSGELKEIISIVIEADKTGHDDFERLEQSDFDHYDNLISQARIRQGLPPEEDGEKDKDVKSE